MAFTFKKQIFGFMDLLRFKKLVPNRRKMLAEGSAQPLPKSYAVNETARILHPGYQKATLAHIEQNTADTKTYTFEAERPFYFRAGQYVTLGCEVDGSVVSRPYAISSAPKAALERRVSLTVKKCGFFSGYLFDRAKAGDVFTLGDPSGEFCYEPVKDAKHIVAIALCRPDTTETNGDCWGFAFVYSGNFLIEAERADAGQRLVMGIHPYHFHWTLAPGESFAAPEVAMVYAQHGLGEMSRRFHTAIRTRLLAPRWQDMNAPRPVLLNSWEACYFDFDEAKLLELAAAARKADIDLFVLDDGWFKGRNDTSSSLGDWVEDKAKLPDGLPGLCRRLNEMDLELGLWVEPEAVSPNSDLYRAHPDWAFVIPGRRPFEIRQQYTLDFSREEVVEGIWQQLERVLRSCPIKYLKWDMNRSLANVYSAALPAGRQGEVYHRYVLGVYELQRRVTETFPGLLLENCAGGGARFDCGMLYYSPQIWCSDNTDARARLLIQYGTSLFYPGCVMGAHFSTVPNHCNGHISTTEARMAAALSGTFGFELDLTTYTPEELEALRPYVAWYRAHGGLLRGGDLYRLAGPDASALGAAWMIAAPDGSEAAVFAVGDALSGSHGTASMNSRPRLPLQGLDAAAVYEDEAGSRYTGTQLMTLGLPLPGPYGQTPAKIWYLRRV